MRRVDWKELPEGEHDRAVLKEGCPAPELGLWFGAMQEVLGSAPADTVLKRAVEIARERIGLKRVAIFLRDQASGVMRGTWGTNLDGATVDEHSVTFDIWEGDIEHYRRGEHGDVYWTVVHDAPIVAHSARETRVAGRGWVCCTPIGSADAPFGMMFNDAGLTGASIDDAKQQKVAMLCSLVATALEAARQRGDVALPVGNPKRSAVAMKAARLLADSPELSGDELGAKLGLSASRIARVFKQAMGESLVEYRNRLRIKRFVTLLDQRDENLLQTAMLAGFGSYAQFHRVFVAQRGTTPGKYLRQRVRARNERNPSHG